MITTWLLILLTPLQSADAFAEDILRGHNCRYEYFEDNSDLSFDQVSSGAFNHLFQSSDSLKGTKKFQHYWVKVHVPELEDSTEYYFNYYVPYDELAIYFANGPPLTKNWYKASDTSRFTPGRTYLTFKKEDLVEGKYIYLKGYMATYGIDKFFFQILNGKAVYTFIHLMNADRLVQYDVFNILFLGAVLIIFLYVLVTYFYNRESVYIYYLLYLLTAGAYLFSRSTMVHDYFFPFITPYIPTITYHIGYTVQYTMHLSYLWFAMTFLNAKASYPLFYKFGRLMGLFFLLCIGITVVSIEFFPKTETWIHLYNIERYTAIILTIAIQIYVFIKRKDRLANFIVVGSIFFIVGAFLSIIASEVFYFRAGVIVEIITFSMGLAYRLRQSENAKISLEKEVERVKMIALRTQMKPHFLFNTINSIRALILKGNKDEAYEHLAVFSKLIRYVLESSEHELVPINQEFKMLDIYVEMEKMRLSSDFNYQRTVSSSLDEENTLIPPLILQPFIENAIIHGLLPKEGPKELDLKLESLNNNIRCLVSDNGVGRNASPEKSDLVEKKSMAIALTKKRISLLGSHESIDIETPVNIHDLITEEGQASGTEVEVILPLILRHETQNATH